MTEHDESRAREAFDHLRTEADRVDAMAALRRVQDRGVQDRGVQGHRIGAFDRRLFVAAAAAVVLVATVVGGLLLNNGDDGSTVFSDDSDGIDDPDGGEQPGDQLGAGVDNLDGISWQLVEGSGPDGPVPLVDGWPITIMFDGGDVGGRAACNGYGGSYSIDGSAISIGELGWNAMGCEPDVAASEAAFLDALPQVESIEVVDGRLFLRGDSIELAFAAEAPVPTAELVGQLWMLDTLIRGETASSVGGDPATLLLDAEGNVSGGTGCRTFSGSYIINGGSVLFPDFAMLGECPAQLASQDSMVVTVLGDGFTAEIDGERLTLTSVGNEGLVYRAITDDETTPDLPDNEPMSLATLLDERPTGDVEVEAFAVESGGGWFLCEQIDPSIFHRCAGRWLVLTDMPDGIIDRFGPNELSDDLGTWSATEEPVLLAGRLRADDRFELTGSEGAAILTQAEAAVAKAFLVADNDAPELDVVSLGLSLDGVTISLGNHLVEQRTREQLTDAANWRLDSDEFRGRVGPFSALDVLAAADPNATSTIAGPHSHCAAPPAVIPEELRGARQLSIQPTGVDSCLAWWAVDLFLDADDNVIGVVFDTWEP